MLLITLVGLPMYGQEWVNFGEAKECIKDSVYLAVKSLLYKDYKYEGDMVLYKDQSGKFALTVPVISSSLKQDAMRVPGTVTVVGTGTEQVITYEFLNVDGRYTSNLLELFEGNGIPGEVITPVKEADPFANAEEYGYSHYLSYTADLQKKISTKRLEGGCENLRIVIKSKPEDAIGLMFYLGAKVGKKASFQRKGIYKIPENGMQITCDASNKFVLSQSEYSYMGFTESKDEITCLSYSARGNPEQIKSVANFLLKSMKCNVAFAPQQTKASSTVSDIKEYEQFVVADSIVIYIVVTDYSTWMDLTMRVSEKQPEPKRELKSEYDIGGLEYENMSAMRLTQILDSLAVSTKEIKKVEITKPTENPFKRKPKIVGVLEYKYCNYFFEKDWAVIDVTEGATEVVESEICNKTPNSSWKPITKRKEIDTNLCITIDGLILMKKIGEKTRYYKCLVNPRSYQSTLDKPNPLPYIINNQTNH